MERPVVLRLTRVMDDTRGSFSLFRLERSVAEHLQNCGVLTCESELLEELLLLAEIGRRSTQGDLVFEYLSLVHKKEHS